MNDDQKTQTQLINELETLRSEVANLRQENQERQKQQIVAEIALLIHQSVNLDDIFQTTVTEARKILQSDRVIIYQIFQDQNIGLVRKEAVSKPEFSLSNLTIEGNWYETDDPGETIIINDLLSEAGRSENYRKFLESLQIRANLVIPIISNQLIWGLLIANHCNRSRSWQPLEIKLMQDLAIQLGIAVNQDQLIIQLHQESLEQKQTHLILERINQQLEQDINKYTRKLIETNKHLEKELGDRVKTQAILKDREAILRSIGDNLSKAFIYQFVLEPNGNSYFSYLSAGVERETGFTVEQLLADISLWSSLILEEDLQLLQLKTQESLANLSIFDVEFRRRKSLDSKEILWMRLCSTPRRLDNGNTVWDGIQIDITDLKRTEEKLRQNQTFLIEAQKVAKLGNWSYDIATQKITWTEETFQLFQRDFLPEEPNFEGMLHLFYPEDAAALNKAIEQTLNTGEPYKLILRSTTPDGSILYLEAIGQPQFNCEGVIIALYGTIQDVTERELTEQKLRQNQALLLESQKMARLGNWEHDLATGKITWTEELFEILNRDPALGEPTFEELLHLYFPEDQETLNLAFAKTIKTGEPYNLILRFPLPDGSIRYIDATGRADYNAQGEVFRVYGTAQDITERQLIEQKLRQNQGFLAEAQRVAHIGTWNHDVATQKLTWTEELFYLFNLDPTLGEPTVEQVIELHHPEDREKIKQAVERAIKHGESYHLTFRLPLQDGSIRYIDAIGKTELNAKGEVIRLYGTAQDITERQLIEQKLRQNQARLIEAQQVARIGNWEYDLATGKITWTEEMFNILDCDPARTEPNYIEDLLLYVPEDQVILDQAVQRAITTGESYKLTLRHPCPDGSIRYINAIGRADYNAKGEVFRLYGTAQDITEQKETEIALEEFNRRWRSLLDNVQLIVIEVDNQGNVNYINPFFEKLTDFTSEEVIGKHWCRNFIPSYLQSTMMSMSEEIFDKGLENYTHYQNPIITKSGEERMIAWNNTLLKDISGQVIAIVSIGEDITERYHLERMKSEFVSIVSHELRTPLTSIQASLSLLSAKIIDPHSSRGEKMIQIAMEGVDRLARLVNDILDLERLESGKMRLEKVLCDSADLINTAIAEMQQMANQAGIIIDVTPRSFPVKVDGDRIVQVLVNLLSNAIKFSPPHSSIRITVELISPDHPQIQHLKNLTQSNAQQEASFLLFTVSDQGRGISQKNLKQIFERFQQIDASDSREKGGTGLGLPICRNIIEQHGGIIWAESMLGKGSTFYFTVPLEEIGNLDQ